MSYCNCKFSSNTKILESYINHSFCEKCGSILLKSSSETIHYTLKQKQKEFQYELNPIHIIKSMKKKTEEYYPNIYNEYNNPNVSNINEKDELIKPINIYLKHRKKLLSILKKLIKIYDYYDVSFYQCLFFLDIYLSHDITEEMSEKSILYYLVGYFLCAIKLKETDIVEPTFDSFLDLEKNIYLSPKKIALYEVLCLKKISYNIFSYSPYEWMKQFLSNGVVFNSEVDHTNEIILIKGHRHSLVNTISKYSLKLLLEYTDKKIYFKFSPMYLALSLIQITREKYIKENMIKHKLFSKLIKLYGVDYNDYQNCYEEIKIETVIKGDIQIVKEFKNEEEQRDKKVLINLKKLSIAQTKKSFENILKFNNIFISNMIKKSSQNLVISKDNVIIEKDKEKNKEIYNKTRNHNKIRKTHLSIDCTANNKTNNENISIINLISQNEINEQNFIKLKSTKFPQTEREEQKLRLNNKKIIFRSHNKNHFSMKKMEQINIDKLFNNINNEINSIEYNFGNNEVNNLNRIRRKYKNKTSKDSDTKINLPEIKFQ